MEPFQRIVQEQASRHRFETLNAWIGPPRQPEMAYTNRETEFFSNPLRAFLWDYSPTTEECETPLDYIRRLILGRLRDGSTLRLHDCATYFAPRTSGENYL